MFDLSSRFRMIPTWKEVLPVLLAFLIAAPGVPITYAATPSLGVAATYGVLASTYTNTSAGTRINGDVGFTTGPAVTPEGAHTNYGPNAPYATAGANQGTTLSALASEACTFTFPSGGAINLSTDTTHGPIGTYTPGVYCSTGAMDIGGSLTLNGNGMYVFRTGGALTSTAGAAITLIGASVCDVFWTPAAATTLAANTTFAGTVIANAGITVGANTTWSGRALAFDGTVTTDTVTLTVPICIIASSSSSSSSSSSTSSSSSSSSSSTSSSTSSQVSSSAETSSIQSSSANSADRRRAARSSAASSPRPVVIPAPLPEPTPVTQLMPETGVDLGSTSAMWGIITAALLMTLSYLFMAQTLKHLLRKIR